MLGKTQNELLALGYRELKGIPKNYPNRIFMKLTSATDAYTSSTGARGANWNKGGLVGGKCHIPQTHPADIFTKDYVIIPKKEGVVRKVFRRISGVLPQGQDTCFMKWNDKKLYPYASDFITFKDGRKYKAGIQNY